MKKKKLLSVLVAAALSCSLFSAVPVVSQAADTSGVTMYRLYNPNSGEHFYTKNASEKSGLVTAGWKDEGIGWIAPEKSNTPVYRLYNENAGDHHYTMNASERDGLIGAGWKDEGTGWYSDDNKTVPLYREYNPNAVTGTHNYTTDKAEHDGLVKAGWKDEGIGWYGLSSGEPAPTKSGFEIAKDYIVANGERGDDGYTCYKNYTDGALAMSYADKGKLMFTFVLESEKGTTSAVIGFSADDNVATALADYSVKDGLNVRVAADPIKTTYDAAQDTLTFSYYSGSKALYDAMGSDSMDDAGSKALKLGFILWNKWLKNIGTSINDVGFPAYSGA